MAYGKIKVDTLTYDDSGSNVDVTVSSLAAKIGSASPTFTGDVTLTGAANNVVFDASDNALEFSDNAKATFGTGGDLEIYHNASNSIINDSGTGDLQIQTGGNTKLTVASTGINVTGTAEVDGVDVAGPYKQTVVAITQSATPTVDLSTGNYFTLTQNANVTSWTFSNPPASRSFSFVIELANVSYTTAWTLASGTIKWPADTAPTLSASKTHLIILTTDDGGTTYRASSIVDYTT
tara:strand:- start:2540 stop:3247 length:708 start_codon:yes stop_codon:yes gene_type:complete